MPRIEAPTVREHHDRRRERLLNAARACLLDPTLRSVGFEHVGPRAGIRRNSVYLYFPSDTHLYLALAEEDVPRLRDELEAATAAAPRDEALAVLVETMLAEVPRVELEVLRRLATGPAAQRGPEVLARVDELRDERAQPLAKVFSEYGLEHPQVAARLALGLLDAAARELEQGADPTLVRAMAADHLRALARHSRARSDFSSRAGARAASAQ